MCLLLKIASLGRVCWSVNFTKSNYDQDTADTEYKSYYSPMHTTLICGEINA